MDAPNPADPYLESLRRMSPEQKLAVSQGLRETAWQLTAAGVRMRQPELAEEDVQSRVLAIFSSCLSLS